MHNHPKTPLFYETGLIIGLRREDHCENSQSILDSKGRSPLFA